MNDLLPFLQKNEIWVYIILGVVAVVYLQRLIQAWQQWQGSAFGLEREIAQRRFSSALTLLVLLVLLIVMEFLLVSFVAPSLPQMVSMPTPTLDLLATPTVTLPPGTTPEAGQGLGAAETGTPLGNSVDGTVNGEGYPPAQAETTLPGAPPQAGATASPQALVVGCTPGEIEWISPKPDEEITATIELKGTVNVPNLGFYKYEYALAGSDVWNTIAAGNQGKIAGQIGFWNTSPLTPGDYQLRLVVADNQNNLFPACVISVRVGQQP